MDRTNANHEIRYPHATQLLTVDLIRMVLKAIIAGIHTCAFSRTLLLGPPGAGRPRLELVFEGLNRGQSLRS